VLPPFVIFALVSGSRTVRLTAKAGFTRSGALSTCRFSRLWANYKIKLELKSNLSEILPVNFKFTCPHIYLFALKARLKDLKFEFCLFKLEV